MHWGSAGGQLAAAASDCDAVGGQCCCWHECACHVCVLITVMQCVRYKMESLNVASGALYGQNKVCSVLYSNALGLKQTLL